MKQQSSRARRAEHAARAGEPWRGQNAASRTQNVASRADDDAAPRAENVVPADGVTMSSAGSSAVPPTSGGHRHRDRWHGWIRSHRRLRIVYRALVGLVGVTLMITAVSIGWLPGPGGLPLFLLGLAVLATEFAWASALLHRAREQARRFTRWAARQPRWCRALASLAVAAAAAALIAWGLFAAIGTPAWVPQAVRWLPGLR